jgi:hypothetical protein
MGEMPKSPSLGFAEATAHGGRRSLLVVLPSGTTGLPLANCPVTCRSRRLALHTLSRASLPELSLARQLDTCSHVHHSRGENIFPPQPRGVSSGSLIGCWAPMGHDGPPHCTAHSREATGHHAQAPDCEGAHEPIGAETPAAFHRRNGKLYVGT